MRKILFAGLLTLLAVNVLANTYIDTSEDNWTYGRMHQWRVHTAFTQTQEVIVMNNAIYALSNQSLFSIDGITEQSSKSINYHNRLTDLNGSMINQIGYNSTLDALLLIYQNGQIDVIDTQGDVYNIPDLWGYSVNIVKK